MSAQTTNSPLQPPIRTTRPQRHSLSVVSVSVVTEPALVAVPVSVKLSLPSLGERRAAVWARRSPAATLAVAFKPPFSVSVSAVPLVAVIVTVAVSAGRGWGARAAAGSDTIGPRGAEGAAARRAVWRPSSALGTLATSLSSSSREVTNTDGFAGSMVGRNRSVSSGTMMDAPYGGG